MAPVHTAESTSRFVQAGDVRVHLHEAGEGPVLLCIHGGAPGAFGWGNFGYNMDEWSKTYRVIIVDLPGYGLSDKPVVEGGRYTFYANVFKDMLAAMGIDKAHVLGMATGGAAAAQMAILFPEIIDRLLLVSSAGGFPLFTPSPSEGTKAIQSYYGGDGPSLERMRQYMDLIVYDKSLITDEVIQERYDASVQPEFMVQAPEGRGHRPVIEPVWKDLDKIRAKTLVVWGRDNRIQGYDNALFMFNQIPDVEVHLYGKTGLWIPYERPEEFTRLLHAFLDVQGA